MTTSVTTDRPRAGSTRVVTARAAAQWQRDRVVVAHRRKAAMVGACYSGLVLIVAVTFLVQTVASTAVALPLFVVAAAGIVFGLHPRRTGVYRALRS